MTRIALADDDQDLRDLVADLLREHGLEVLEATDGASLLELLHGGDVALVVTDLWMPRLNGNDVLQLRRASGDETPFVVITAAPQAAAEVVLDQRGVVLLRKPFTEQQILETVRAVLDAAAHVGVPTVVTSGAHASDAAALDRARDGDEDEP